MNRIGIEVLERNARGGVWSYDMQTSEVVWSDGVYAVHGVDPAQYTPSIETALSFYTPESRRELSAALETAREHGSGYSLVAEIQRADGQRRYVQAIGQVELRQGKAPLVAGAFLDVHEQTRARNLERARERRLLDETRRWRTASENTGLGLLDFDVDADTCRVIGRFNQNIGLSDTDESVMPLAQWRAQVHADDRADLANAVDACLAGEKLSYVAEYRFHVPGRAEAWIKESGSRECIGGHTRLVGTVADITARKRADQALEQSRHRLRQTLSHAPIGIALVAQDGRWISANRALCAIVGYTETELLEMTFQDITHPDDLNADLAHLDELLAGSRTGYRMEKRYFQRNGDLIDVQLDVSLLRDEAGEPLYFISHIQDISDRKRDHHALFEASELAEVTFEAIGEGVIRIDADGCIREVNSAGADLLGVSRDDLMGAYFVDTVQFYAADELRQLDNPVAQVLAQGERVRVPIFTRLRRRDGQLLSISDSISPIHDDTGAIRGAVFVFQDISDARRMNDDLAHQASHDALTGLVNRRGFADALARTWSHVQAGTLQAFVMYIDLDRFKTINDACGHAAGDDLLRRIALRLRSLLRESDVLARLGGDEFAAIVHPRDAAGAETVAAKFVCSISDMGFMFNERRYPVGLSIGIAPLDRELQSTESALVHADAALYVAKDQGRGRYHFYADDRPVSATSARYLDNAQLIQAGLEQGLFTLYLQAVVNAEGQRVGYEALLRFDGPDGVVAPDEFLPAAQRLGMMQRVDQWVVGHALTLLEDGVALGPWPVSCFLSVNLSPISVADPDFGAELLARLDGCSLEPECLRFEITASDTLIGTHFPELIQALRARGHQVWFGGFTTGYNGFDMIKRAPVDGVKIDRALVRHIESDPINRAVVRSIADISRTLELGVIAEGVETDAVRHVLLKAGIPHLQGFLFQHPEPAATTLQTPTDDVPLIEARRPIK